jgi:hypothetical protein
MPVYESAGSAHLFCSQMWHRSGKALRRTIKLAYFFHVDVIELDSGADDGGVEFPDNGSEDVNAIKEEAVPEAVPEESTSVQDEAAEDPLQAEDSVQVNSDAQMPEA